MFQQLLSYISSPDNMGLVEGTYTCVRGQSFVDFLLHLGVDSTMSKKLIDTHWTVRIWKEEAIWGASFMCREFPQLNMFETMTEGIESSVSKFIFGGKAKLVFTQSGTYDGFSTVCESEKFGKMTWDQKFSEEKVNFTFTCKGQSMTETWERLSRTEGDYIFEKGDNVEAYFNACGYSACLKYLDSYKINIEMKGGKMLMSEHVGDLGKAFNTIEPDVESPFYIPGDVKGSPSGTTTMTSTGVGKYTFVYKSKDGLVEEWTYSFTDWGLVMNGLEKKTGQTCKLNMKRFRDTSGTFKMVTTIGFEKLAKCMGVSSDSIKEIVSDKSTRLVVLDKGNGYIRHQLIRKKHPMDYSFKLNEQFSMYHPLLKEVVRCVGTVNRYTFCMISKTSKGPLKSVLHFNDHFITWSVSLPDCRVGCKMILERCDDEE